MKYECDKRGSVPFEGNRVKFKKGLNDVPDGSLDNVGGCRMITKSQKTVVTDSDKRDYPIHEGSGWYLLSNGKKVRGKEKALNAQIEIDD